MKKVTAFGLLCCLTVSAHSKPATQIKKVRVGDRQRSFRLYVPARLDSPPALVVALHGGGGTALQMERSTGFSKLADQEGFVVVYPEGIGRGWNDGRGDDGITAQRLNLDDVGFVRGVVEDTVRAYGVDRGRIFATGISNGGFMSSRLGAEAADVFAAIAPVVGGLPKARIHQLAPVKPVSVLIVQGTADPLVPYAGGRVKQRTGELLGTEAAVKRWCEVDGCSLQGSVEPLDDKDPDDGCTVTRIRHTGGRQGSEVVLLRVEGGGHTWPGSSQYLPKSVIGLLCKDFDATLEIWDFFRHHAR